MNNTTITTDDMTSLIMLIHGHIMFNGKATDDYRELLAAVNELQYFLKQELQVPPIPDITMKSEPFRF